MTRESAVHSSHQSVCSGVFRRAATNVDNRAAAGANAVRLC